MTLWENIISGNVRKLPVFADEQLLAGGIDKIQCTRLGDSTVIATFAGFPGIVELA